MAFAGRIDHRRLVPVGIALLFVAACGGNLASATPSVPAGSATPSGGTGLDEVRLQLQWTRQARFAGYFAAVEQGYYEANGIDLTILDGGPDVVPEQVGSAADGPEFTISWVPRVLVARAFAPASDLVDIGQVFQRSGTLAVSWRDSEITAPADFADRKLGIPAAGNELELTAGLAKAGLEPEVDYETVVQGPTMSMLLAKRVDVAEAMIYDEYALLLEAENRGTGNLNQPTDFNVINWNDEGTAMLQDAVFARASWLAQPGNEDLAVRFLRASFQGWIYCRANPAECVSYTLEAVAAPGGSPVPSATTGTADPGSGAGHQAWMLNEVNGLIWPSPDGIGALSPTAWQHTVGVLLDAELIPSAPPPDAYRTDLATRALEGITEDTRGTDFRKGVVEITAGGN